MIKAPFFSLIIPTKDRASLLKLCIQSALDQSFTDFELIIVDDGSTDGTSQMVSETKDPRIKYINQAHKERSSARNHGISLAQGQYICFVDDDDLLEKSYLSDFSNCYHSPDYKEHILRTGYKELKKDQLNNKPLYKEITHKHPVRFATYNMCGVWSLAIPRQYLMKDQFPLQFPHWQDTHLILRLLAQYPFKQLENHNYIYRRHASSGSLSNKSAEDFLARAEINVAAIEELFTSKKELLSPFLSANTLSYLKAEKYIQYAVNAKKLGYPKTAKQLFKKSKDQKFDLRLWKHYTLFFIS